MSARIDDKLSRLKHAPGAYGEDTIKDLIRYLVLITLAIEDRLRNFFKERAKIPEPPEPA